jgi:hypothetical protein
MMQNNVHFRVENAPGNAKEHHAMKRFQSTGIERNPGIPRIEVGLQESSSLNFLQRPDGKLANAVSFCEESGQGSHGGSRAEL